MYQTIDIIDQLKSLDLSKRPYAIIRDLLTKLISDIGFIKFTLHQGKYISRSRINCIGERFSKISELSYRPAYLNKTCQRASLPEQTVFYGSLLPSKYKKEELSELRITPVLEGIDFIQDKLSKGYSRATFSLWHVIKDINLIAILHNDKFIENNPLSAELVANFNYLASSFPKFQSTIIIQNFLAEEFGKEVIDDYDYAISAVFSDMIINLGYDGVLYPSVKLTGETYNIAIEPQAANTKLQLKFVAECPIYKSGDRIVIDNDVSSLINPNQKDFTLKRTAARYQAGETNCLNQLGLFYLNQLSE